MRILLVGEYSNVHNNLAQGLRQRGHHVVVASNGDTWKNYPRDIDLSRERAVATGLVAKIKNFFYNISFAMRVLRALPKMKGFDVVQIINPKMLLLTGTNSLRIYRYLRKNNKKMVMGAYGDDFYYVWVNLNLKPMRYSDYNRGEKTYYNKGAERTLHDWTQTDLRDASLYVANDADMIIAGAYEYWLPYHVAANMETDGFKNGNFNQKLHYVPFPYKLPEMASPASSDRLRVFIGINRERSVFKGTDVMLRAAQDLLGKYPERMELKVVESVPFAEYQSLMDNSDVVLDQLYAYGPGMNALLALSKGIITMTGGEPEHYDIMGETNCRPIINVEPTYESVFANLESLILDPEIIPALKTQSRKYVENNYDYLKVAEKIEKLYQSLF